MIKDKVKNIVNKYIDLYPPIKIEGLDDESPIYHISNLIFTFIVFLAVYLSFKCNNGFIFGDFILAIFFAPFYIIYQLAVNNMCGML